MQHRQLRLGDILDDYCPRERRVTNHAVVAMVGPDVKQTRCTTCDAEHEYKHAKVPRQRRKTEPPALYAQVAAGAPKRIPHEVVEEGQTGKVPDVPPSPAGSTEPPAEEGVAAARPVGAAPDRPRGDEDEQRADGEQEREHGPVHRPLIRASLPRPEGQPPPARPLPEFTVRQAAGRPNRFRTRTQRGAPPVGNRPDGGPPRSGMSRQGAGRSPQAPGLPRPGRRHGGPGRKRSK
jgi:hypothetical protein